MPALIRVNIETWITTLQEAEDKVLRRLKWPNDIIQSYLIGLTALIGFKNGQHV